jgi:uncharacterized MAPEG superfamily protein
MVTTSLSASLIAVLGYAAWTLTLLIAIAGHRLVLALGGRRQANSFSPWGDDVSPFSARLCRAHANCVENLPIFAAIVTVAVLTGGSQVTDPLALWVLAARVAQSTVHLASTSTRAVSVRFAFMAVQVLMLGSWSLELLAPSVQLIIP